MDRYNWNILGLCAMLRKNFGEMSTDESTMFTSVKKRTDTSKKLDFQHIKDIVRVVLGCRPQSLAD